MREGRDDHPQAASPRAVQQTHNERLTRRVTFGTMAGGENPGPGRPEKNRAQCLVDDLRVFRATEGSTESVPLVFGVETVLWSTAAKKGGEWYRGVVEAAECFMTRWHRDEAESSWLRHTTVDAKSDDKGRRGVQGGGAVLILLSMNAEMKW